jgi:leader peptidase (prepilin peptidase)/N-methyltransferase
MSGLTPFWAAYLTLLAFFFGACWGSFLNVCIHRIPREESVVTPRSHCPGCGHLIAWYDNIPLLSWLALRARCRSCGTRISARYFLVELLTAVLFLMVWNRYGFDLRTPIYWVVVFGLVLGTFVDLEHMIIPDRCTIGGMILGVAASAAAPVLHDTDSHLRSVVVSLIGLAAGFGSLWLVGQIGRWIFKKDAMGFGDVKLMGAIGAFFGAPAVLFTIMVSALLGSVAGVAMILLGGKEWQSRIPYGPYIAAAALLWMLGGHTWWTNYWTWLAGGP